MRDRKKIHVYQNSSNFNNPTTIRPNVQQQINPVIEVCSDYDYNSCFVLGLSKGKISNDMSTSRRTNVLLLLLLRLRLLDDA